MTEKFQYIIITSANYTSTQLDEFDTQAINYRTYARHNNDYTKYVLKCAETTPPCFRSHTRYSGVEIKQDILNTVEWQVTQSTGSKSTRPKSAFLTLEEEQALDNR